MPQNMALYYVSKKLNPLRCGHPNEPLARRSSKHLSSYPAILGATQLWLRKLLPQGRYYLTTPLHSLSSHTHTWFTSWDKSLSWERAYGEAKGSLRIRGLCSVGVHSLMDMRDQRTDWFRFIPSTFCGMISRGEGGGMVRTCTSRLVLHLQN